MLEISKPKLNTNTIMEQIREEFENNRKLSGNQVIVNNTIIMELSWTLQYAKALIDNAESISDNQIKWPKKLNFFPFNISIIQEFVLKIYNFIFKKQRLINSSLIEALKTSVAVNEQLISQVENLLLNTDQKLSNSENHSFANDCDIKKDLNQQKHL
jgi:O-antigen chain-terminating methyltransferase